MITVEEAIRALLGAVRPLDAVETGVADALGAVLAEDVVQHAGPLPVAVGQPGIIPPRTPTGCI